MQLLSLTSPATGKVCGNATILNGPSSAPTAAVTVNPGTNLNDATKANPAGTTFYLTAGTHTLTASQFGQVVPKDGNTYIGAPGAVLDGQGVNKFAFVQRAVNVTVKNLKVTGFVPLRNERVINQSAGEGWTIEANWVTGNKGAGVGLGTGVVVRNNCLEANGAYGLSGYRPPVPGDSAIKNVVVDRNEIVRNNTDDWETQIRGCGCSGAMKFWDVGGAQITNNWIHHNKGPGLWADTNNVDFLIQGNTIEDNDGEGIWYEISYNARIVDNILRRNALVKGRQFEAKGDNFPIGAIYISESGGDSGAVNSGAYTTLQISNNVLENNWGGVVLWENAGRFCGGSNPTRDCTQVAPATLQSCTAGSFADGVATAGSTAFRSNRATFTARDKGQTLKSPPFPAGTTIAAITDAYTVRLSSAASTSATGVQFTIGGRSATNAIYAQPHYSACRWKTQNVSVTGNLFAFDKAAIGCTSDKCGRNALFSQYGTYPRWSPYMGHTIQNAVTFERNNRFANNTYQGKWLFTPFAMNRYVDFATWQAAPYKQDVGSVLKAHPRR